MSNIFQPSIEATTTSPQASAATEPQKAMQEMMDILTELRFVSEQESQAFEEYQGAMAPLFGERLSRQ